MNRNQMTRRQFIKTVSSGSIAAAASTTVPAYGNLNRKARKLSRLKQAAIESIR